MIRKQYFVNKLRQLDYSYKTRQKRTDLYRCPKGPHYIAVPLSDPLEEAFVISSLRQAGCKDPEIREFLASAKV